jgi:hypothetical protein
MIRMQPEIGVCPKLRQYVALAVHIQIQVCTSVCTMHAHTSIIYVLIIDLEGMSASIIFQ